MKIDLHHIIKEKSPGISPFLPHFAIRYLSNLIHEEEINMVIEGGKGKDGVAFVSYALDYFQIERHVHWAEELPLSGRYIFASNHPLGGIDGFVLLEAVCRRFGAAKIIVNDILMHLEPLKSVFIPINKHGRQSVEYAQLLNDALSGDVPVIYFPSGMCSRKINGVVQDLPWKKNFTQSALKYQRDLVPIFVDSVNSEKFYNFALFRKTLGIQLNLEMILLPEELFKKQGGTIPVYIGKAVTFDQISKQGLSSLELSLKIREMCYKMQPK